MINRKHIFFLLGLIIVCAILLDAYTGPEKNPPVQEEQVSEQPTIEPRYGGELVEGVYISPKEAIAPHWLPDSRAVKILGNSIFEPLVELNEQLEPIPLLAEKWEQSEDGLTWTLFLKNNVRWHDGTPFTAEDVIFTWALYRHPDFKRAEQNVLQSVESFESIDSTTIQVKSAQPMPQFMEEIATLTILPRHILLELPVSDIVQLEFSTIQPIGTGPFRLEEWRAGEYIRLVAFDDYHGGRPYLDTITTKLSSDYSLLLRELYDGKIDMLQITAKYVAEVKKREQQGDVKLYQRHSKVIAAPATFEGFVIHPLHSKYQAQKWWLLK